jgi:hypothetical protein
MIWTLTSTAMLRSTDGLPLAMPLACRGEATLQKKGEWKWKLEGKRTIRGNLEWRTGCSHCRLVLLGIYRSAKIFNHYFLPHIEKVVVRTPMVGENHYIKPVEFPDAQDNIEALKFFVSATVDAAKEVALVH